MALNDGSGTFDRIFKTLAPHRGLKRTRLGRASAAWPWVAARAAQFCVESAGKRGYHAGQYLEDAKIMNLSKEDSAFFFRLYRSVLAYTNRQLNILPGVGTAEEVARLPQQDVVKLREEFHGDVELLTRYLDENPCGFSPEDLAIVAPWRQRVSGDFYILRHLKAYTVFASEKPTHLYGVLGLEQPIQDVLHGTALPVRVRAVLLPFRDRIIYDGFIGFYPITFGPGVRRDFNETYRQLKDSEGIIESLTGSDGKARSRTSPLRKKPDRPAPDWRPALDEIVARTENMRQAETEYEGAALGLLRAAASLARAMCEDGTGIHRQLRAVRRAMTLLEKSLRAGNDW